MKKFTRTLSVLTLVAFMGLPALSAAELQATVIRDRVIGDSLAAAYTEERGAEQTVMVFIGDIDHETVQANRTQPATTLTLAVAEEYENQAEIEAVQADIMARRAASRAAYLAQNTAFANKHLDGKVEYISKYSPMIIATLDSVETNQLALNGDLEEIELYEMEIVEEEPIVAPLNDRSVTNGIDYLDMINAEDVHDNGYTGQGINIGILENGLPNASDRNALGLLSSHCYTNGEATDPVTTHASSVSYIAKSVAPNAQLYAAYYDEGYIKPFEWLIDQGANVINISLALGSNHPENEYGYYASFLDHVALNHCVSVAISAGNTGESKPGVLYDGKMSYNAIVVGAVDAQGTIASFSSYNIMEATQVSRPDICAPGVRIQPVGSPYTPSQGTSYSTPMVTGAVALICQQNSAMLYYPDTIKAILAANVSTSYDRYVTSPLNSTNGYERYGAGILNCLNVYTSMLDEQYYIGEGFDPNTLNARHSFTVDLVAGKTARFTIVCLRDNSYDHTTGITTTNKAPRVNLSVYRNGTYYAQTDRLYYGNLKIIEFTPTMSGSYTVFIDNIRSISTYTWYSVAWCQID